MDFYVESEGIKKKADNDMIHKYVWTHVGDFLGLDLGRFNNMGDLENGTYLSLGAQTKT